MPLEPDIDIVTQLDAVATSPLSSLAVGVNLFAGAVRAVGPSVPAESVFVMASGGLPSRPIKGQTDERRPRVDIRVRGAPLSAPAAFQTGQALARAVFDAVDQNPPAGYIESRCLNSQPSYMGPDDDKHHEWLISIQMIVDYTVP